MAYTLSRLNVGPWMMTGWFVLWDPRPTELGFTDDPIFTQRCNDLGRSDPSNN